MVHLSPDSTLQGAPAIGTAIDLTSVAISVFLFADKPRVSTSPVACKRAHDKRFFSEVEILATA